MPLRTSEEFLHAKFQTYSSKTVACGGGTDTMRIFTFRGSKKFFLKVSKNHKNGQKQLF